MVGSLTLAPSLYSRAGASVVTSRLIVSISSALLFATLSFGASAAPKDTAANAKIEEAINVHYLATDFAKAEGQLLGVVKACGKDGCSPAIVGRAWMYIGLVRGSGKNDLAGARDAFNKAKAADGTTALDKALATPEVQGEFDAVFGEGAADAGGGGGGDGVAAMLAAAGGTAGECSPAAGGEIEIRRPIPLSCKAPAGAVKAVLAYKEFGGTQFANLPMTLQNGQFRSPIPCSATKMEGALLYVVVMKDAAGATVSTVGSLEQPAQLNIVKTTTQPPPAFPGEAPPARCAEEVECPAARAAAVAVGVTAVPRRNPAKRVSSALPALARTPQVASLTATVIAAAVPTASATWVTLPPVVAVAANSESCGSVFTLPRTPIFSAVAMTSVGQTASVTSNTLATTTNIPPPQFRTRRVRPAAFPLGLAKEARSTAVLRWQPFA